MANLHVERFGQGKPMVFLHGWGMPRSLLRSFAQEFAAEHTIWLVDLPGYGQSEFLENGADVQVLVRFITQHLPTEAYVLVGWSLGALVALQLAAMFPQHVTKLALFTATPCFMATATWPHGVAQTALHQVGTELAEDYAKAMNRFLQLQLKNLPGARDTIRDIKALLAMEAAPSSVVLQQGLQLLAMTDMRQQLAAIATPTFIINGDRDSLIPSIAARLLAESLPHAQTVIVHGAGHLPFITHAAVCRQHVQDFLA
jgi:pimeloyl-[acyl-carrier protein] methyl ester esterase